MSGVVFGLIVASLLAYIAFNGYFIWLLLRHPKPILADELHHVVCDDDWRIVLYRSKPASGAGEPVLLVHGLGCNHLNFKLPPGESLIDVLTNEGYDCWSVDLRACRTATPAHGSHAFDATVDDLLIYDLPAAVRYVLEKTGKPRLHWIGHSMGGMMLYAYDLTFGRDQIASGTTLGSPPGFIGVNHRSHSILVRLVPFVHGFLSMCVRGCAPYVNAFRPNLRLLPINWDNVHPNVRTTALFNALDMPLPKIGGQMDYWASRREWIMLDGAFNVTDRLVHLQTPLFAVFGGRDVFISESRATEFFNALPMADKRFLYLSRKNGASIDYGHIDLAVGKNGVGEVYTPIVSWLREHPVKVQAGRSRSNGASRSRKPVATRKRASRPRQLAARAVQSTKPSRNAKATRAKASAKSKPKVKAAAKTKPKPKARVKPQRTR